MKLGFRSQRFSYDGDAQSWDRKLPAWDSEQTLVTVFGSPDLASVSKGIEELREQFPTSMLIGCSTSGEIHGERVLDESLSVGIARFGFTKLRQATVQVEDGSDSFEAGKTLVDELYQEDLRAIFVLSDGLNVNGSELIRGINSKIGPKVVVTGGLAGDGARFEKTWVASGDSVGSQMVTAVGFYGEQLTIQHGSRGGWDNFGPRRKVTRSEANVLWELDGEPALALYERYLGDKASELPSSGLRFPLAIKAPGDDKVLVRTLLAIDREAGTMTFAGDIPEGSEAQLMKAQLANLIDGAEDAARTAYAEESTDPGLAIAVSCVGRRLVLGDRTEDELDAISSIFGTENRPLVGFYSYGELSPVEDGACGLHNQTMTLTILSERGVKPSDLRKRLRGALKKSSISRTPEDNKPTPIPREAANKNESEPMQIGTSVFDLKSRVWSSPLPEIDSPTTLVLAFGSPSAWDQQEAFETLVETYPHSHIMGCSGSGEIAGTSVLDDSVSVAVTKFTETDVVSTMATVESADDSFGAGETIAQALNRPDLKAIFILSEGLNVNGTELVRGVNSVVDDDIVITGGLAGDGARFEKTWIFAGGKMQSNAVAAVGFYGDNVVISHGSQGGWDSFGPERTVTKSEGNVLYELDGRPALALYKIYLGDKADELPASGLRFPIALLGTGEKESRNVVRTLLAVDHEKQSLTFAGDVPEGTKIQLMKAHFDRLIDGADGAASMTRIEDPPPTSLAIAVSCVGRRLVLGDRTEDELDAVSRRLGEGTTLTGFYSYGELSPVADGSCDLHNQTMTLTVISEQRAADQEYVTAVDFEKTRAGVAKSFATARSLYDLTTEKWTPRLPAPMDSAQTLVLVFGSPEAIDKRDGFKDLNATFPKSKIIGCSGAGEISGKQVHDEALSVAIIRFAQTLLKTAQVEVASADDSFAAGENLARELSSDALRSIFILSEGLNVNGTDLVRGVNSVVTEDVVVTGGLAGDGSRFEKTWIFGEGEVRSNVVVAVGFYGDYFRVAHGSQGGWDSFGPERTVTKSTGNILYELDGTPALALYKTYLGAKAAELPASGLRFPLSILDAGDGEERNVVRTLLSVDHEAESLIFAGDIPEGARVQLMKANFDRLITGAETAASMTHLEEMNEDALAIAVSCVGRRLVLGARTEDELEAIAERLPKDATIAGFYSYGELSPIVEGRCDLHNQTMTLTVLGESATPRAKVAPPVKPSSAKKPGHSTLTGRPTSVNLPEPPTASRRSADRAGVVEEEVSLSGDSSATALLEPADKSAPVSAQDWVRPVLPVRRGKLQAGPISVEKSEDAGVMTYRLLGKLDEKFSGATLGRELRGIVVMDLAEVHRVTSFGVREWLAMLREASRVDELYLVRCSESIANQLATIRAFAGSSRVVSFFAPYLCEHCGTSFNALMDVEFDRADIRAHRPPSVTCLDCGTQTAALDEDPRTFFSFVEKDFSVPGFVRKQLENLPEMRSVEPVEKVVNESGTFIRVNADLDENIRWRRLLDGVEGKVVMDFAAVSQTSSEGIISLVMSATRHMDEADFIFPVVSAEVLTTLFDANVRATFQRVEVFAQCSDGKKVKASVDIASNKKAIKNGEQPRATCRECAGSVDLSQSLEILRYAAGIKPEKSEETVEPKESSSPASTAAVTAPVAAPEPAPQVNAATASAQKQRQIQIGIIATLVVILIAVLIYNSQQDPSAEDASDTSSAAAAIEAGGADEQADAEQLAAAEQQSDEVAEEDSDEVEDSAPVGWSTDSGVRPNWSDRKLVVEEERVLFIGEGSADSRDAALDAARQNVVISVIDHLQSQLRGREIFEVIAAGSSVSEDERVETFRRQMGPSFHINRIDQAFRIDPDEIYAVVQFEIPRDQVDAAIELYGQVVVSDSADFAMRFPTLGGPEEYDVMVLRSRTSRLQPRDVVMSEDQRPLYTLEQMQERVESQRFLQLVVSSNGVAKSVTLRTE